MSDYRNQNFMTPKEVADILRIGKSKCYELLKSPDCPFNVIKFGRNVRIPTNNFYIWYDSLKDK